MKIDIFKNTYVPVVDAQVLLNGNQFNQSVKFSVDTKKSGKKFDFLTS